MKKDIELYAECYICGNKSSYDKQSLKGSTHNINGCSIVLCCPCEDDLFHKFLRARLSKKRAKEICTTLMSDEASDLMELYNY